MNERLCVYFYDSTCGYFQHFIFELNWIFFYIYQLSSLFYPPLSQNALLSTLFSAIIFSLSLSSFTFYTFAHTQRQHTSHAAEQITFTYLSRSRFILFLLCCCRHRLISAIALSSHTAKRNMLNARYFYLSSVRSVNPFMCIWRFINNIESFIVYSLHNRIERLKQRSHKVYLYDSGTSELCSVLFCSVPFRFSLHPILL